MSVYQGSIVYDPADPSLAMVTALPEIAAGAKLDIRGGGLVLRGANLDLAAVGALLQRGYAGGTWAGDGIVAAAGSPLNIGYTRNTNGTGPLYNQWMNQSVTEDDILIRLTPSGDSNLDGLVNELDAELFNSNQGWRDFDHDGSSADDAPPILADGSVYKYAWHYANESAGGVKATWSHDPQGNYGDQTITLALENLPQHTELDLVLELGYPSILGDSDTFTFTADGVSQTVSTGGSGEDQFPAAHLRFAHSAASVNISFSASGLEAGEQWTVWNVVAKPIVQRVWVEATDAAASEDNQDPATFTIRRSDASGSLEVYYELSGTATPGVLVETQPTPADADYTGPVLVEGQSNLYKIIFADGQESVNLTITPTNDALNEDLEMIELTLVNAPDGAPGLYAPPASNPATKPATQTAVVGGFKLALQLPTPSTPEIKAHVRNDLVPRLANDAPPVREEAQGDITNLVSRHPDLATTIQELLPNADPEIDSRLKEILTRTADYRDAIAKLPDVTFDENGGLHVTAPQVDNLPHPVSEIYLYVKPSTGADDATIKTAEQGFHVEKVNEPQLPFSFEPASVRPTKFGDSGTAVLEVVIDYMGGEDANGNTLRMERRVRKIVVQLTKVQPE